MGLFQHKSQSLEVVHSKKMKFNMEGIGADWSINVPSHCRVFRIINAVGRSNRWQDISKIRGERWYESQRKLPALTCNEDLTEKFLPETYYAVSIKEF